MSSSFTIDKHYEALAHKLVESGRYASINDVLRDGMQLLEEREALREFKLHELRSAIQHGLDSGDAGLMRADDVKHEGRRILAQGPSPDVA